MGALIFVPLLALTMIVALALWVYTAHNFISIVEDTAAGNEQIAWPDEPLMDWIWQSGYLAWTMVVWFAPAILFGRLTTMGSEPYHRPLYILLHAAFAFWVAFPVSLLSTMAAESRWAILHLGLFQRLARRLGSLLLFYVISFGIVIAMVPLIFWLIRDKGILSLLGFGVGLGTAIFLYARMLGRLACLARLTYVQPKKKKRVRPARGQAAAIDPWDVPEEAEQEASARFGGFQQPRDLPALATPNEEAETGYDVRFEAAAPPVEEPRPRLKLEEDLPIGSDVEFDRLEDEERQLRQQAVRAIKPDPVEESRLRRKRERKPERPLLAGLGSFFFSGTVPVHWAAVAAGFIFLGLLIRGLQQFWPD